MTENEQQQPTLLLSIDLFPVAIIAVLIAAGWLGGPWVLLGCGLLLALLES